MGSMGERIADAIPAEVIEYVSEHPRALYAVTIPLVILASYNLEKAWRLHTLAEHFVKQRAADAARAASEALGG